MLGSNFAVSDISLRKKDEQFSRLNMEGVRPRRVACRISTVGFLQLIDKGPMAKCPKPREGKQEPTTRDTP